MVAKVTATPAALEVIAELRTQYPGLMFYLAGGCCDNGAPNCYLPGELTIGQDDLYLGDIGGCPFHVAKAQYRFWQNSQLIVDVIDGQSATFSLEGPMGKVFVSRSRPFTLSELAESNVRGGTSIAAGAERWMLI